MAMSAGRVKSLLEAAGVDLEAHAAANGDESVEAMLNRIARSGRSEEDLVRSIVINYGEEAGRQLVQSMFETRGVDPGQDAGGEEPTERFDRIVDEVVSGQRSLDNVRASLDRLGRRSIFGDPIVGQEQTIPAGGTLYAVRDVRGQTTFYAVYDWEGVSFSYRIGDQADLDELFPDAGSIFNARVSVTQRDFDQQQVVDVGTVDEILGATESLGEQLTQAIRTAGYESLPDWVRQDPQVMFLLATATAEGWSPDRLTRELSGTRGFQQRYGEAWEWAMEQVGGDHQAALDLIGNQETAIESVLRRYRGGAANTDPGYLQQLMTTGWTAESMSTVLSAEQRLRANPEMLASLNRLLTAAGMAAVGPAGAIAMIAAGQLPDDRAQQVLDSVDMTSLLNGNEPGQVFDLINDAVTLAALEEQGLTGLDLNFVRELRNITGGLVDEEAVNTFAQEAAMQVLRFMPDVDLGRYGLSEEEIIAQAAGRAAPSGRSSAEVAETVAKIIRERQEAAGGFTGFTSFVNQSGRLQIAGLRDL